MSEAHDPKPLPAAPPVPRPMPASERGPEAIVYRPLSFLAIAGFGVSVLYAVIVVGGALLSFWGGTPWLMDKWTVLIPILGALLSWLATWSIQRSEGTLAGTSLARWGLLICLFTGLGYWAYFGATYFAIRSQADAFARGFLDKIVQGKLDAAFVDSLRPVDQREGLSEEALRQELEMRHNPAGPNGAHGPYSTFAMTNMVRLLTQTDSPPEIISRGASLFEYAEGGYHVTLNYHIKTSRFAFDAIVTVQGNESRHHEFKGRRWYVKLQESGVPGSSPQVPTEEGSWYLSQMQNASRMEEAWLALLRQGRADEAFLLTLPAEQRQKAREGLPRKQELGGPPYGGLLTMRGLLIGSQLAGPAGLAPALADAALISDPNRLRRFYLDRDGGTAFRDFLQGALIRHDDKSFWAPDKKRREQVVEAARESLRQPVPSFLFPVAWEPHKSALPIARREGNRLQLEYDAILRDMTQNIVVEGRVLVEGDATKEPSETANADAWRIRGITLLRGKTIPPPERGPGP